MSSMSNNQNCNVVEDDSYSPLQPNSVAESLADLSAKRTNNSKQMTGGAYEETYD